MFVLRIAYSLLYGKRIDIGSLLLDEFAYKLGQVQNRDPVIYYARFLMIIANYLCKDLVIDDRNDTLPVPVQPKKLFATLVAKNLNAEVQFVLPEHIRVQLSNLYSSPSPTSSLLLSPTTEDVREGYTSPTLLALPSPHQSGTEAAASVSQSDKRINSTSASMTKDGNDETETAPEFVLPEQVQVQVSSLYSSPSPTSSLLLPPTMEDVIEGFSSPPQEALMSPHQSGIVATTSVTHSGKRKKTASPSITKDGNDETETATHPPQKKNGASNIRPSSSHFVVDQEMPPADIRDAIPVVEIPSSPEEERAKNDLLLLEPAREQEDRQVLMNAASILKSQLVTTLTRQAERISTQEMMTLADKCYNALEGLGDDFSSFRCSISKLIAHNQKLQSAAKKIEDWNECDIEARYIHQEQSLIEEEQGLSSAQGKLSTTETHADSLKIKREELKGMIRNLTEELNEVEETVKTLRAETDQREEARSIAKAELRKLEAEKQESRSAIKAIKDQYNADKKVLERMSDHLLQQLQQVRK
ncbi:hypothetical protein DCAR_0104385 [Daucus carota subsp. sativus]|uniref:Uncharacterized protein n=1 Tax=Daucus carota subsp. sativus TaxID=79200 RepID=A0A166D698_DAUCS|nr:hypothetical protein DCAR_0104385 [Daucus carota subsp. sativus]